MATNGTFEFRPRFREVVPVYRNITRVWISDGEDGHPSGMLCAEYVDGNELELGSVTLYPIAVEQGYQGTEEEWIQAIVDVAATDKAATVSILYANSTDGTTPPSLGWSATPNPESGKYTWTQITLSWFPDTASAATSVIYTVSYNGLDTPPFNTATNEEIDALFASNP